MKREDWRPKRRLEREYEEVLFRVWNTFEKSSNRVPGVLISTAEFIRKFAEQSALRMITMLRVEHAKTWREAAREASKAELLYAALRAEMGGSVGERVRELVRENAKLISSFPESVAQRVASAAAAQQQAGGRAGEFRGWLTGVVRSRAQLIARTEISKASSALTQARSEDLGINWYVWETSEDERVRFSHKKMQGVVVAFDDPPSPEALVGEKRAPTPYNAGDIYNCRCYPAPVVRAENLQWPRKVYHSGVVQMMTLNRFKLLTQTRRAA